MSKQLKGKTGGYRTRSGRSKFHGSDYRGYWMDSSWELKLAKRLDELNIIWEREPAHVLAYVDINGRSRKYYPDFWIPSRNYYIEVKGYWTTTVKHKMSSAREHNPNTQIIIIDNLKAIEQFQ